MNRRLRISHGVLIGFLLASTLGLGLPSASAAPDPAPPPAVANDPAAGATINVTTTADQWDSPNPSNAGKGCSLREALELVYLGGERGCGPNIPAASNITIALAPGTYILSTNLPLPFIQSGRVINISGPGVVIDGGYAADVRYEGIFHVAGGQLNLKDLTLQNGNRPGGGAIWMEHGTVTADHIIFENNQAVANATPSQSGGAILNEAGDITVSNSYFGNNVAVYGGGAVQTSYGYFFHDIFYDNRAGRGGAFYVPGGSGTVTIEQSKFEDNKSRPNPLDPPHSGYTANADVYGGGAISNYGKLEVIRSVLKDNHTELDQGGGAVNNHGALQMGDCVITGNTAVANGSGDSNTFIKYAFGGAIINYGTLDLVRCSIHGNQADYAGAILNYGAGNVSLYNSTVSNNTAENLWGGVANDLPSNLFQSFSPGAEVYVVNSTIGKNKAGAAVGLLGNELYQQYNESVYLANAIVDTGCALTVVSRGGSVTSDFCASVPDAIYTPSANPVLSMSASINLEPLQPGNSTLPEFMVQPIKASSSAAGIGVDGPLNCNHPFILHRDQNLAPRPNPCAAGAIQTSSLPPKFDSNPAPGLVTFPLVDFEGGPAQQQVTLILKNTGGGVMNYNVQNDNLSALGSYVVNLQQLPSGTLYAGQQTPLTFTCTPPSAGDFWQNVSILTDAPNRKRASFKFRCTGVGRTRQASTNAQPGPYNQPQPKLGQTAHSSINVSNPSTGQENLTASAAWANPGGMWGAPQLDGPSDPSSPAANIPPGGSANFNVDCTPPSFGSFVNTLVITTNDPNNPVINYDVACEALVDSPPEDLAPQSALGTGIPMEGIAVSPDGQAVLAGGITDNHLRYFARDTQTGALTPFSFISAPGMSGIFGVVFSHDNQNVYYTAQNGNGLVTARGVDVALQVTDVLTSGTSYLCHVNPITFCQMPGLVGPRGIGISPDDQYVYVAGFNANALSVYQRNLNTGALSYSQIFTRTINGVNVLGGATRVVTSPDGAFIYVAAQSDDAVVVFQRDAVTGRLSYQTAYKNGLGGLTTLHTPTDLALSPDGSFLYVAAANSNAINIFSRSPADGGLTFNTTLSVSSPWGVAVSPDNDGRRLYLANYGSNAVQVYGRDPVSGTLSYVHAFTQTLTGPVFIAPSPDNQDIYVTQYDGQAIQQFKSIENQPVLSHISPASALVNSGPVTLTVAGGRFYPDSQIVWNGAPQPTTFDDEHTLEAVIPGGLINAVSTPPVLVRNPRALTTDSSAALFTITPPAQPPVPSISSTNPPEADFGGSDLLVFVYGANFAQDAVAYYNHHALPTTFISNQTLQVSLSADILAQAGEGGLEVVNGGGAPALDALSQPAQPDVSRSSAVVSFKISAPGHPARPALDTLTPSSVVSGTASLWVLVHGHSFSSDPAALSVGRWNGQARDSIVVDANNLLLHLTQQDLAAPVTGEVTVLTAGGGESDGLPFRVRALNETPVPVLASVVLDGFTLYLNGSDFAAGAQARFNGVARATTFVNSTQVKVTVTAADHGVVLTVVNPGPGGGSSNALNAYLSRLFLPFIRH